MLQGGVGLRDCVELFLGWAKWVVLRSWANGGLCGNVLVFRFEGCRNLEILETRWDSKVMQLKRGCVRRGVGPQEVGVVHQVG